MCDPVVEAMAAGLTVEVAAARIGILAPSLFNRRCVPSFSAGHSVNPAQLWWEVRAIAMAIGEAGNTQIVLLGATDPVRQLLEGSQGDVLSIFYAGHCRR
jgi:hypothetical protein